MYSNAGREVVLEPVQRRVAGAHAASGFVEVQSRESEGRVSALQ
tara:strand:- start:110 stop:241 length:132 start_codon:yes stop_codon:yes gene_type:complete